MRQIDNRMTYAAIYIIQRLLTRTDGNRFVTDLEALILAFEDDIYFL
jgi:hypothetical protein